MATITQRLAFLISANADGAIKAFDKTAQQADKQLGKAQKNIDRLGASMTRFGATGLAAAGTLGAGLFRLAQGAIEDQKAQALLAEQLRSSTGATEAQIASIEKSIDTMARATGVADDQLRPALGNLIRATGDTAKAQQLLQTSMDISAATGRDLSAVTIAMGRAANGQISSLSRLGIPLSENVKKSKDFDAALQALNQQFGGAAAVAADTYAGKMARAQVAISEAGESLGSAFIPFVEQAANAITKGIGTFDKLNTSTGGLIGKLASFGTIGLGAISALSLIGGQAIKLRDRFTTLGDDGVRSINKIGRAAQGLGATFAALAASEVAFSFFNEITDSAGKTERALQRVNIALGEQDTTQLVQSFRELVKEEDNVLRFSNIWSDFGKEIKIVGGESSRNIEDIDKAFNKVLKESGPQAAKALIDALALEAKSLDKNSQQFQDNMMLVDRYRERINLLVGSQNALAKSTGAAVNASRDLAAQSFQASAADKLRLEEKLSGAIEKTAKATGGSSSKTKEDTAATQRAAEAKARFAKKVEDSASALRNKLGEALDSAKTKLKEATDDYNQYIGTVSQAIAGTVNLGNAQSTAVSNAESLAQAQQAVTDAQKEYNTALRSGDMEKAGEAYTKLKDAQKALNVESAKPQGFLAVLKEQADAAVQFGGNIEKLLAAGLDEAALNQILASGADAGNAIAQELLSGADPGSKVAEVNRLVASTQGLADRVAKATADKFRAAGVAQATALVEGMQSVFDAWSPKLSEGAVGNLATPVKTLVDYGAQVDAAIAAATVGMTPAAPVAGKKKKKRNIPKLATGGIVQAEPGGRLVLLGEGGRDEAVVPLPAAGSLGGGATFNITVNAGLGVNGSQVGKEIVDVLVEYQRRVGALPIKVNG